MKKSFRIFALILALVSLFLLVSCGKENAKDDPLELDGVTFVPSEEVTNYVCIQMTTGEKILVELYPDKAPITVENFQKLVSQKFYDGIIFHRVIAGFMIQGGCPEGVGTGGPGWTIKGEFSANGVDNPISHERGVISMGRTGNQYSGFDTAGSQFFICHSTSGCAHLDGQYAAFGKVISGMDVVDRIASVTCDMYDKPVEEQKMEKVYFVAKSDEEVKTAE